MNINNSINVFLLF